MQQTNNTTMVVIATIGAPHGTSGDMRLNIFCHPKEQALNYKTWYLRTKPTEQWIKLIDEAVYQLGDKYLIHLDSVTSRDAAKHYTNAEIAVLRSELSETCENEYYWVDLINLEVFNTDGERMGVVVNLLEAAGAHDILVVHDGIKERLIPFVEHYIKSVDFESKQIIVQWQKDY